MFNLTIRSLLSHKIRFALTTFAVVLGVSFVVAAFVLSDSLRSVFDDLSSDVVAEVDVEVRGKEAFEGDAQSRASMADDTIELVRGVEGVRRASPGVGGFMQMTTMADELIEPAQGAPTIGVGWDGPELSVGSFDLLQGNAPGSGQIALDIDTYERYGFALGDSVNVRTLGGTEVFEVDGVVRFGKDNGGGAIYGLFDVPTAQTLFDSVGALQTISISADPTVSQQELADRLNAVLPSDIEAVTQDVVQDDFSSQFNQIIDIFRNILLGFAVVALIVSSFIVKNTFAIVLGQRIRELGLLRAIGASGRQVFTSVMLESLLVGVLASVIGAAAGLGVAKLIKSLIDSQGGGLPEGPLIISPAAWIAAFLVGIGITLLAALDPARKAAGLPPIAALREGITFSSGSTRRRAVIGLIMLAVGVVLMALALIGEAPSTPVLLTQLGGGALLVFLAIAALSPLVAKPIAYAIGAPIRVLFKTPGRLAQENAARSPQRTAATASALMVGLALVAMALVVGDSLKKSFLGTIDRSVQADYFVSATSFFGFTPQFAVDLEALPEIAQSTGFQSGKMLIDGSSKDVIAFEPDAIPGLIDVGMLSGGSEGLAASGVLVHVDPATDLGLSVGDTVNAEFARTGAVPLTVVGIYKDAGIINNWAIASSTFRENFGAQQQVDQFAAARLADGVDYADADLSVNALAAQYPEVQVDNRADFKDAQEKQIDQTLFIVNALLAFAVIIAILGIANTMALSVFERTRELGLLRAVGMSRRQMRRMVRWESVIVAVFGAVLGVSLGVIFGWAMVSAIPDSVISTLSIPVPTILVILVLAAVVGILAAIFPARRAGRLNVLDAISHT